MGSPPGNGGAGMSPTAPPAGPPPPPVLTLPLRPAAAQRPPSSWDDAFEEGSLLSPVASGAYGRSLSCKASPMGEDLQALREINVDERGGRRWPAAAAMEARNLCRLALPISITNLAGFSIGLVVLSVTGRLGQFELSAAILATSVFNVTGLSLLMGFAAAMETLCGQAFGARNFHLVGVVFQRAIVLTTIMSAAVALMWSQAEALLLFFRRVAAGQSRAAQDPLLSRSAGRYIRLTIPALWCTGMFEASKRYLMAQGVVRPASAVTLVALALAPLYSWLFILHLDWRLDGAAIAVDAIQLTMALLLGGYIVVRDTSLRGHAHATWHGWGLDALRGWGTYLKFALPSVAMICCEWWTFEAMILMSGWLKDPDVSVAVMGICINTSGMQLGIVWMFVAGFAMAVSTRVSNSLGAGCPHTARRATWTAVGITSAIELASAAAILLLRRKWAVLFTDAPTVVSLTASVLPIFALTLPGDGANAVLQGLLRGSGRQEMGAVTNVCSYWLLGIPSAAFLAFREHLGVHGLWWGLVIVNSVQGSLMMAIALRFNFRREAAKAVARVQAQIGSTTDGAAGTLHQPLLQGPQCSQLEQGLLGPADLAAEERQLTTDQLQADMAAPAQQPSDGQQAGLGCTNSSRQGLP